MYYGDLKSNDFHKNFTDLKDTQKMQRRHGMSKV